MGARGKLKIASHLTSVDTTGTTAADVQAMAPHKPEPVAEDPELSALWDVIVPTLDGAGLVSPSDAPAIEMALRHFLIARRASDAVAEVTVSDKAHSGSKKNPAEAVFRAESEMFLKYAQQLGMTFVSRARTPAAKGDGEDANPFAASG
jgi:P27 family predicted phage terminase small subunit